MASAGAGAGACARAGGAAAGLCGDATWGDLDFAGDLGPFGERCGISAQTTSSSR